MRRLGVLLVIVAIAAPVSVLSAQGPDNPPGKEFRLDPRAAQLSPEEVAKLEADVAANPDNLEARVQLVSFYSRPNFERGANGRPSLETPPEFVPHVLWLIEHHPELRITGAASMRIGKMSPAERLGRAEPSPAAAEALQLWQTQIDAHRDNAAVLSNAAIFFTLRDRTKALQLWEDAILLDPDNLRRRHDVANTYMNSFLINAPVERAAAMQAALRHFEFILSRPDADTAADMPGILILALNGAGRAAAQIPDDEALERIAERMLAVEGDFQASLYYSAHTFLGLSAVRNQDLAAAKEHLQKLATGPKDPKPIFRNQPDMSLAAEIYAKGEHDVVTKFLKELGQHDDRLTEQTAKWTAEIEAGRCPSFERISYVSEGTRNAFIFARLAR